MAEFINQQFHTEAAYEIRKICQEYDTHQMIRIQHNKPWNSEEMPFYRLEGILKKGLAFGDSKPRETC
jgi:hypothetical protein